MFEPGHTWSPFHLRRAHPGPGPHKTGGMPETSYDMFIGRHSEDSAHAGAIGSTLEPFAW